MLSVHEQREILDRHPGMVLDEHNGKAIPLPTETPAITYQVEGWLDVVQEMRELFPAHWEEIAQDQHGTPLEMDYLSYEMMARIGMLHLVTVRSHGEIVGYHLSHVHPHLHYKSTLSAMSDIFYLKPAYRRGLCGYKMLKLACETLRERGVKRMYMGTSPMLDLSPLLKRLGFQPSESNYSKAL